MDMKTYHCMNPDENPFLHWMDPHKTETVEKEPDLVQQFKNNPDSFFSSMIPPTKPLRK